MCPGGTYKKKREEVRTAYRPIKYTNYARAFSYLAVKQHL